METENTSGGGHDSKARPAVGRKTKKFRALNWKILLAGAIAGVALIGRQSLRGTTSAPVPSDEVMTVPVVKLGRENLARSRTFEAEFRPYQAIDLHANVAGFIQSIKVDAGDRVQAGDVLAVLFIPELKEDIERAAATQLRDMKKAAQAAAAYNDAHMIWTRLSTINQTKPRLIALQELDTAQAKDGAAEAALAAAGQEARVSLAEVHKLDAIRNYCTIVAPFSGVITKRYADEGSLVQGGVSPSGSSVPVVRLSQNQRLRLDFPVDVSCIQYIKAGAPVRIRVLGTGQTIPGKISRFTRNVDMATRTMETEVEVENPDLALTPGVYAEVSLTLEVRKDALAIPSGALSGLTSPSAFVLTRENELEERSLTLGLATADRYEVVSGLKEGDIVMIGSRSRVKPGQKVEPKIITPGAVSPE